MLHHLRDRLSPRALRLFACACCRRVWGLLQDKRSRTAIHKLEAYADDLSNERLRTDAYNIANPAFLDVDFSQEAHWFAACVVLCAAERDVPTNLIGNLESALAKTEGMTMHEVRQLESDWLKDIFDNPLYPATLNPTVLTSPVTTLAQEIYDDRTFDRLPDLADALEAAGCTSVEVLNHCRGKGPHVRGCWVIDLILGTS